MSLNLLQNKLYLKVPDWPYKSNSLVSISRRYARETANIDPFTFIDFSDNKPTDVTLSYVDFDRKARQIAALLQTRGRPGDRVLLLYSAGLDYLCAFYGCLYASMIAVPTYPPLNPRLKDRLITISNDCGATIALTTTAILKDRGHKSTLPESLAKLYWLATDRELDAFEFAWNKPKIERNCIAFLQYTSGSTGRPKGVIVTHENLLHNLYVIALHLEYKAEDRHLTWLPPFHDMGLIGSILGSFAAGIPVRFMKPAAFLRRPERWLQQISSWQCTISGAPNFAYELCLKKITDRQKANLDLSSWALAFSGSETVRLDTIERFTEQFSECGFDPRAFYPCYGMAETTLFVTGIDRASKPKAFKADRHIYATESRVEQVRHTSQSENNSIQIISCGMVAEGMTVEIVDSHTQLPLPDRSIGEIWVKGPSVAAGYWNQKEYTKATFNAVSPGLIGNFLRTGDLGFKYNGEIYISGRLKDIIIIRGVNYYPQDIEATVDTCHKLIKPGCGIAFSVNETGTEKLIFVQEIGRRNQDRVSDISATIQNAIAVRHDLQVGEIVFIEKGCIPKTTSGKLARHRCREQYLNRHLPVVVSWINPVITERSNVLEQ